MRRSYAVAALVIGISALGGCAAASEPNVVASRPSSPLATPTPTPTDGPGQGLVWSAEFDGPQGSTLDPAEWSISDRGDGYGNHELQVYTPRPENVFVDGTGALRLIARNEPFSDPRGISGEYTSGRIETRTRFEYGRVEARIKVPEGAGLWSAFWLFGDSLAGEDWPAVGEIDIMELIGNTLDLHNAAIGATTSGERWLKNTSTLTGVPYANDWHVYAVEWDEDAVSFIVDDQETFRVSRADLAENEEWPFDRPYSITLNLAVGGDWPGPPNAETAFPAEMLVDYVRVYDSRVVRTD